MAMSTSRHLRHPHTGCCDCGDKFLSIDEYIRSRRTQDDQLNDALRIIRTDITDINTRLDTFEQNVKISFNHVERDITDIKTRLGTFETRLGTIETRLDTFEQNVETRFNNIETRLDVIETRLDGLTTEFALMQRNFTALLYNQNLQNPRLPIQMIVVRDPLGSQGIREPNGNLFPKNAKEFYSLRAPRSARLEGMLLYLISFYHVELPDAKSTISTEKIPSSGDDSDDVSDSDDDEPLFPDDRHLAVHKLEIILGLSEDKFTSFRALARERRQRAQEQATAQKRQHSEDVRGEQRPARLPYRSEPQITLSALMRDGRTPTPSTSPPSFHAVGWREGPTPEMPNLRPTPSAGKSAAGPSSSGESQPQPDGAALGE